MRSDVRRRVDISKLPEKRCERHHLSNRSNAPAAALFRCTIAPAASTRPASCQHHCTLGIDNRAAPIHNAAMKSASAARSIAIFPGMFDPPTNGHLDIIRRGRLLFDRLIVAVGQNPEKEQLFPTAERLEML